MSSYTIAITKMSCSEGSTQKCGPQITWGTHKKRCHSRTIIVQKERQNVLTSGMQLALTLDVIIKECAFECATRAACVAHSHRAHTDKLTGPCDYCGSFYAHSADMMKNHVNECADNATGSVDNDD